MLLYLCYCYYVFNVVAVVTRFVYIAIVAHCVVVYMHVVVGVVDYVVLVGVAGCSYIVVGVGV